MNIAEAKEQIKNGMKAYFTKDEFGDYRIPIEKQRPIFMIGPPGVGKTAIMEQVASELNVGLVSYSMTHHTRQSALGLPYIATKEYQGTEYQVSEYTMSEIISSIYDLMKETGVKEGILFLDEINCISETLAPCMLQFLQYKVFGQHRIPKGWIVVTAGNPPEYNKSVRDYDIVTWDRLKRIDVEPDYEVWKVYAGERGIHPAVTTYLAARKKDFYKIESTVDGKHFVTARGWDDLSEMMKLYEENDLKIDDKLISQYLQEPNTARDFAIYYDLFNKYKSDYKVDEILKGQADRSIVFRAQQAQTDERFSLIGLLFDAVLADIRTVCQMEDAMDMLTEQLKLIGKGKGTDVGGISMIMEKQVAELREILKNGKRSSSISSVKRKIMQQVISAMENQRCSILEKRTSDDNEAFDIVKEDYYIRVKKLKKQAEAGKEELTNIFSFCEEAFGEGDEILIFVTELTSNYYSARFIGHYGCEKYYDHNKELQFGERGRDLIRRVNELEWEL